MIIIKYVTEHTDMVIKYVENFDTKAFYFNNNPLGLVFYNSINDIMLF